MTENESKTGNVVIVGGGRGSGKTMKIQLDLLKELEAYRALGTVEEIQKAIENLPLHKVEHKLLQEYQTIGTVRECKIAVERMKPKKPIRDKEFSSLCECPSCRRRQKIMYEQYFCKECGQKFDWE